MKMKPISRRQFKRNLMRVARKRGWFDPRSSADDPSLGCLVQRAIGMRRIAAAKYPYFPHDLAALISDVDPDELKPLIQASDEGTRADCIRAAHRLSAEDARIIWRLAGWRWRMLGEGRRRQDEQTGC
jgi:hypothetical protein